MRHPHLVLIAMLGACTEEASAVDTRIAPDPQTLEDIERAIELGATRTTPETVCEAIELCVPPTLVKPEERPRERAAVTPPPGPRETPRAPLARRPPAREAAPPVPEKEGVAEEPVSVRPRLPGRALVPRARRPVVFPDDNPPGTTARDVALGIGGTGLVVSAVALGANIEARSNVGYAIGGAALGIGVIGLATAGILTLTQEDEDERARVRFTGDGLHVSF